MRVLLMIGLAGLIATAIPPQASAQERPRGVQILIYPGDARRYEEEAHGRGRPEEERYWHEYGAGLERQGYRDPERRPEERRPEERR